MSDLSKFTPLSIAILTVSDSRVEATDKSGNLLKKKLESSGHILADKKICKDNIYEIRALVSGWIVTSQLDVVLTTGGT